MLSIEMSKTLEREMSKVLEGMLETSIKTLSKEYGFKYEEGIELLKMSKSNKKEKMEEPKIPLPYIGKKKEEWCNGMKKNKGLYSQCTGKKIKGSELCRICKNQEEKKGKPTFGYIDDRLKYELMEYKDEKGKKVVSYGEVLKKLGISKEDAEKEAKKYGVEIPEDQYEIKEQQGGRPNKEKEKKMRGRPIIEKKKIVSADDCCGDLIASLIAEINVDKEVEASAEAINDDKEVEASAEAINVDKEVEASAEAINVDKEVEASAEAINVDKEVEASADTSNVDKEVEASADTSKEEKKEKAAEDKKAKKEKATEDKKAKKEKAEEEKKAKKAKADAEKKAKAEEEKKTEKELEEVEREEEVEASADKSKEEKKAKANAEKKAKKAKADAEKKAKADAEKKAKAEEEKKTEKELEEVEVEREEVEREEVEVKKFTFKGKLYLLASDGVLYDIKSQDPVGMWNEEKKCIDEIYTEED
jgi:hypothetical protein